MIICRARVSLSPRSALVLLFHVVPRAEVNRLKAEREQLMRDFGVFQTRVMKLEQSNEDLTSQLSLEKDNVKVVNETVGGTYVCSYRGHAVRAKAPTSFTSHTSMRSSTADVRCTNLIN